MEIGERIDAAQVTRRWHLDDVRDGDDLAAGRGGRTNTGWRVFEGDAVAGRDRQGACRGQVRLGMWLASPNLVADDGRRKRTAGQFGDDSVGQPSPRHGHHGTGDLVGAQLGQQIPRPGPPRHGVANAGDHSVEELVDDLVDRQVDPAVLADVATRLGQVAADDRVSVFVAPRPTVSLDELELALDPVRLGVDERAIHVPQDGGWAAGAVGPPG